MTRIEQLHYTWAARGVEGVNRFQIASISPGLTKPPLASVVPIVRKICLYERGTMTRRAREDSAGALDPISFGWFDHRDVRVAFCRTGLPPIRGKVGNFAAHVLVGPPEALAESEVARRFESAGWWMPASSEEPSGDELELPTFELDEWEPSESAPHPELVDAAESLAERLLALEQKSRLAVHGDPWRFGRILRTIAFVCPEALGGLSISTFEVSAPFPFRVIGSAIPRPGYQDYALDDEHPVDAEFHETFARLSKEVPGAASLGRAATAAVSDLSGDERRQMYRRTAQQVVDAAAGRLAKSQLSDMIGLPGAVQYVAKEERGREAIADLLLDGDAAVSLALAQADPPIADDWVRALCAVVRARYEDGGTLRGCGPTISLLLDIAPDEGAGVARSALAAALRSTQSLMLGDVAVLLAFAAQDNADASMLEPLIRSAAGRPDLFLSDTRLPTPYRTAIFRTGLVADSPNSDALSRFLVNHTEAIPHATISPAEADNMVSVLNTLSNADLRATLPRYLTVIASAPTTACALRLVLRLDPKEVVHSLLASGLDESAAPFVRRFAVALLADNECLDGVPLARQLLRVLDEDDCDLAASTLTDARDAATASAALDAAEAAHDIIDSDLRLAVARHARAVAVAAVRSGADARQVWEALHSGAADPSETVDEMLRCAVASPAAASHVLGWLAVHVFSSAPELVRRGGHLSEGDGRALALNLVRAADRRRLSEYDEEIASSSRPVRSWWREITRLEPRSGGIRGRIGFHDRTSTSATAEADEGVEA